MKCLTLRRAAIPPMRSGLRAMLFDPASSCLKPELCVISLKGKFGVGRTPAPSHRAIHLGGILSKFRRGLVRTDGLDLAGRRSASARASRCPAGTAVIIGSAFTRKNCKPVREIGGRSSPISISPAPSRLSWSPLTISKIGIGPSPFQFAIGSVIAYRAASAAKDRDRRDAAERLRDFDRRKNNAFTFRAPRRPCRQPSCSPNCPAPPARKTSTGRCASSCRSRPAEPRTSWRG